MKYKEFKIPSLQNHIAKSFYWLECDEAEQSMLFLPDGNPELMMTTFPITVSCQHKSKMASGTKLFWGQFKYSGTISCIKPYKMFGIKFQPWALRQICQEPHPVLVDRIISAELILPQSIVTFAADLLQSIEIGRASCRERV